MATVRLKKINNTEIGQKKPCHLAEEIFAKLNQGSLYEIHQILSEVENEKQRKCIIKLFIEKFDFNFTKYI